MRDGATQLSCSVTPLSNNNFDIVFFPTLILVVSTILLEWISHESINCCATISDVNDANDVSDVSADATSYEALSPTLVEEQPHPQVPIEAEASLSTAEQSPESAQKKTPAPSTSCIPDVSPNIRANRLITAIFLYAAILTLFVVRMRDVTVPHRRPECASYISMHQAKSKMPEPNWWVVMLLNVLPFICASFSLLRNIVDCLLVRWEQGLGYGGKGGGNTWPWAPCLPLIALSFVPLMAVKILLVFPVAFMMGRPLSSTWLHMVPKTDASGRDDIEMQSEETRGLVDNMDGEDQDKERSEGPPAYDEAVYEREIEVKEMQQWLNRN